MPLKNDALLHHGQYRIVRFIGSGGFGCTYEAEHTLMNRRVAIKELFVGSICNRDDETGEVTVGVTKSKPLLEKIHKKFVAEATALFDMKNPGIVHVTDIFEDKGTAYYVMDYIEGESLADIIKREGPMPEERALRYIGQVCDALEYVHKKNRLHLDVKPANIMVDGRDKAILIDFGCSKQYDEESGENTSTMMGFTPGYAPVEQTGHNIGKFLPATDIYSLGATLYKLLTGITPPPAGDIASGDEELKPLPASISDATRRAITQAMRTNKKERPQSIPSFRSLLTTTGAETSDSAPKDDSTAFDNTEYATKEETQAKTPSTKEEIISLVASEPQDNNHDLGPNSGGPIIPEPPFTTTAKPHKNNYVWHIILFVIGVIVALCIIFSGKSCNSGNTVTDTLLEDSVLASDSTYDETADASESTATTGIINGHEWVDLGLPSGIKWATCNVGAKTPEEYGSYFAWGEVTPSIDYSEANSMTYNKYYGEISGNHDLDAAMYNWGYPWRMPNERAVNELIDNCTYAWASRNGVNGALFTSKINGNSIFLPAGDLSLGTSAPSGIGKYGRYWIATSNENYLQDEYYNRFSWCLGFDSGNIYTSSYYERYEGLSVRPIY